jgi:hypothetical protein
MHWHGYVYSGSADDIGSFDRTNRAREGAGFLTSKVPPYFTSHWLAKPRSFIEDTWDTPEDAVGWLTEAFNQAHRLENWRPWPSTDTRSPDALEQLRMGNDVLWSSYTSASALIDLCVVSCPNRGGDLSCPEGRRDQRPEGATRLTGVS